MQRLTIGLLNDSFPPTLDGVASVTHNYASVIAQHYGSAVVATPHYPEACDQYEFDVVRYPSVDTAKTTGGYRAGYPFDPGVLSELRSRNIDIIHSHCPLISTVLARTLRAETGAPVVFTYHTKFDLDLQKITDNERLQRATLRFIVNNINACDDVWVVSEGAGKNLRSIGYAGDYIVMPNGTDFDRCPVPQAVVDQLRAQCAVPYNATVFLFVGRMMWYKGLKISLDGLRLLRQSTGQTFRFIMVGDGADRADIETYARSIGLEDHCVFAGAVHDRETIRAYFTLADLFLFPSDFDTNGIVVREAAACACPAVVLKGSAAAEGIEDGETGRLIEPSAQAMCAVMNFALRDKTALRGIGERAAERVYLSWQDAMKPAWARYETVFAQNQSKHRAMAEKRTFEHAIGRLQEESYTSRGEMLDLLRRTNQQINSQLPKTNKYSRYER